MGNQTNKSESPAYKRTQTHAAHVQCLTILSKLSPSCVLLPDELQLYELCFTTRPAEEVTPAQPRPAAKLSPFERN